MTKRICKEKCERVAVSPSPEARLYELNLVVLVGIGIIAPSANGEQQRID